MSIARPPTPEERALLALAEHFLDTETRHDLPRAAFTCVEAGLDVERAKAAYFGRVAPVLYTNLLSVAGEWAGWNDSALLEQFRAQRGPAGFLSQTLLRIVVPGVSATAESLARFVALAIARKPDERPALLEALSYLGRVYFDFSATDPATLGAEASAHIDRDAVSALLEAVRPVVFRRERHAGERRLEILRAQLRNRRASGVDVKRLVEGDEWSEVLGLPFELPEHVAGLLEANYRRDSRAYHDLSHVVELFEHYRRPYPWNDANAVALAILFHDACYDPTASDNERKSGTLLANVLGSGPLARHVPRACELVLLTARHGAIDPGEVDDDAARVLDCDLAILGAPVERYAAYENAIAAEHLHVPRRTYQRGRRAFLERMLARQRIFLSDEFHAQYDTAARANLKRALGALRAA